MIADPEGPSFIVRTVGRRWYSDGAFVTHDPLRKSGRPKCCDAQHRFVVDCFDLCIRNPLHGADFPRHER
jgi:hypothetical protein